MVATDEVREIFADAHALHASALEQLEAGDICDAAGGNVMGRKDRGGGAPGR